MKDTIGNLVYHIPKPGNVKWIGIRPVRKEPLVGVKSVEALVGVGLMGDHYKSKNGKRQITLIQHEHILAIASYQGMDNLPPTLLRRNVVTQGINLLALKDKEFIIGNALLRYSGECHPCSRMEENLGYGGYNAVRGHGGITAQILEEGIIQVGDNIISKSN